MVGSIYKITNDINDKVYVGKTLSTIEKRFKEHIADSQRTTYEIRPLYAAMRKYGSEHFKIELIEQPDIEQLSAREQYWINYFDSYSSGYNATLGGDGKQLYDYQAIVNAYLSGKLVKDLAIEFECDSSVIHNAIIAAGIDPKTNSKTQLKKSITAYSLQGDIIKQFTSRTEAAHWLHDNNYTLSTNWDNIIATIGRVANGQRKSAYGMIWR